MRKLPIGKLNIGHLSKLLKQYKGASSSSVIVGPAVGEDAAIIDFEGDYLIAKTDPITFATDQIGQSAIDVNANDIACMGGNPKWFLATILLPEGKTDEALVEKIFSQLSEACQRLGIAICGGHTEVTYGLDRPIIVGQMLGVVSKEGLIKSSDAKVGDHILLAKGIAIEATSLLAHEKENELLKSFDGLFLKKCKLFLKEPGISVLEDARIAIKSGGIHALHDPTEGGLATGLHELASASGTGIEVWFDSIPIFSETKNLCDFFKLDPLGVIASGSLLIVCDSASSGKITNSLKREHIECSHIGLIKDRTEGITIIQDSKKTSLRCFDQDEVSKVFSQT